MLVLDERGVLASSIVSRSLNRVNSLIRGISSSEVSRCWNLGGEMFSFLKSLSASRMNISSSRLIAVFPRDIYSLKAI